MDLELAPLSSSKTTSCSIKVLLSKLEMSVEATSALLRDFEAGGLGSGAATTIDNQIGGVIGALSESNDFISCLSVVLRQMDVFVKFVEALASVSASSGSAR